MERSHLRFGLLAVSCLSLAFLTASYIGSVGVRLFDSATVSVASQGIRRTSNVPAAFAQAQTALDWQVVDSPNAGAWANLLQGVSGHAHNDVWAVGDSDTTVAGGRSLIAHWDGEAWSLVSSPSVGSGANNLEGVTAVSQNDVWAVGAYYNGSSQYTEILHWDGNHWSVVPSPNGSPTGGNGVTAVAAASSHDVWAVGGYNSGGPLEHTLILHWNGSNWQIVNSPNAPGASLSYLSGVAARSHDDAWAIGLSITGSRRSALIMHWDGAQWQQVTSPEPAGATSSALHSVTYLSRDNVWAVGYYVASGVYHSLLEHWDGSSWQAVPGVDEPGAAYSALWSISSSVGGGKQGDAWAVGSYSINPNPQAGQFAPQIAYPGSNTLILHYHDGQWERVTSPNIGTGSLLFAITSIENNLWAVGNSIGSSPARTLIEHARENPLVALGLK